MSTRKLPKVKKSKAMRSLERIIGASLNIGDLLCSIREGEQISQASFAEMLGVSRSHLCDIEKGRKSVSLERAVSFAETLGYSKNQFVRLALQSQLNDLGLDLKVELSAA